MNCNAVQTWDQRPKDQPGRKTKYLRASLAWLHLEMNTAWVLDGTGLGKQFAHPFLTRKA